MLIWLWIKRRRAAKAAKAAEEAALLPSEKGPSEVPPDAGPR